MKDGFKEIEALKEGQSDMKANMKEIKILLNKQVNTNQANG